MSIGYETEVITQSLQSHCEFTIIIIVPLLNVNLYCREDQYSPRTWVLWFLFAIIIVLWDLCDVLHCACIYSEMIVRVIL